MWIQYRSPIHIRGNFLQRVRYLISGGKIAPSLIYGPRKKVPSTTMAFAGEVVEVALIIHEIECSTFKDNRGSIGEDKTITCWKTVKVKVSDRRG